MTLEERKRPNILNASRKKRVAAGSGNDVSDVNQLLKQFTMLQKFFYGVFSLRQRLERECTAMNDELRYSHVEAAADSLKSLGELYTGEIDGTAHVYMCPVYKTSVRQGGRAGSPLVSATS